MNRQVQLLLVHRLLDENQRLDERGPRRIVGENTVDLFCLQLKPYIDLENELTFRFDYIQL